MSHVRTLVIRTVRAGRSLKVSTTRSGRVAVVNLRTGPRGQEGQPGPAGDAGQSAYQVYLETTSDAPPLDQAAWSASRGDVTADGISDATALGKSLIRAATASAARTELGAGATGASLFQAATAQAARMAMSIWAVKTTPTTKRLDSNLAADPHLQLTITPGTWLIEWTTMCAQNASAAGYRWRLSGPAYRNWSNQNPIGVAISTPALGWDTRLTSATATNTNTITDGRSGTSWGNVLWVTDTTGLLSLDWAQTNPHDSDSTIIRGRLTASLIAD